MNLKDNFQKFKRHLQTGGLSYAVLRGAKYSVFLIKREKERFRPKPKEHAITSGKLKIIASGNGINILWDGNEVTQGVGLNIAINTLGLWTDSGKAQWLLMEKTPRLLKCRVLFKYLPLFQIWTISIENDGSIVWQIDMETSEWLHIDEFRVICLINANYKTWFVNDRQADFQRQDKNWHDLYLTDETAQLVGARFPAEATPLPAFILENQYSTALPLIQNPPVDTDGHIIGLRHINSKEKKSYAAGYYHVFTGKIKLCEDDSVLDNKVEFMRLTYLEKTIKESAKKIKAKRRLKVLLANMPWRKDGRWGVRAGSRWPHIKDESEKDYLPFPFFLAYATSLLKKNNIQADVIDAIAEELSEDEFLEKLGRRDFDYLVTETSIPSFYYDLDLLQKISQKGIRIILCGPNSEIYQTRFLKEYPFIDFVLCGEYEFTLLELIQSLQEGRNLFNVAGLIYNDNGQIRKNLPRPPMDINLLPWPERQSLPMQKYLDAPGEMLIPSAQIMASRGCPFGCQFCLWPQVMYLGRHYRSRTVKDVVDEMEHLVRKKGFQSVYFDDDTFNVGKTRMLSFCQEIRQRGLDKTQWAIMARPDLMDEEILEAMKRAGLWAVKYGLESADQLLVDNIDKSMDLKKAERMIRYTQDLGIKTHLTFTFGLPGENKHTIEKTIKLVKKLDPFSVQFSITTPFPGTRYYENLDKQGLIVCKDLSCYDGHYKSVIKLDGLSPADLEIAKARAYKIWEEHVRKKRGFLGNLKRFRYYAQRQGLFYALARSANYAKNTLWGKGEDLSAIKVELNATKPQPPKSKEDADILLIESAPWDIEMPPLGIAYLTSYLKKHGFKPGILDLNIAAYNLASPDIKYLWEQASYDSWADNSLFQEKWPGLEEITRRVITQELERVNTGCVGLSVNFAGINFANEVINLIKEIKPSLKIIVGGWGCVNAHMQRLFVKEAVDVFVLGEGEQTLLEVIGGFKNSNGNGAIAGAIFNKTPGYVYTPRSPIMDINTIPWPTFSEFDLSAYKHPILPLFTSRGCIGHCNFCNDWSTSKPYRCRSARNIFEEIEYHTGRNRINSFSFKDLLCNGNIQELKCLSDLIIDSGIKINWDSQAIPRKEMTYELLRKLKKTGCGTLIYGVESFSNNVLRRMGKLFTKEIAQRVLRDTHRAGIKTFINIIVGFPGETEDDFKETLEAIKKNHKYITQIGAVSVCLVNESSDLEINSRNYELILSEDTRIRAKKWKTADSSNTYEIRNRRAREVLALIEEFSFAYATKTI